jgi:hypothetical protein
MLYVFQFVLFWFMKICKCVYILFFMQFQFSVRLSNLNVKMTFSYEDVSIFKPSLKLSNNSLNFQAEILTFELSCFNILVEKIKITNI